MNTKIGAVLLRLTYDNEVVHWRHTYMHTKKNTILIKIFYILFSIQMLLIIVSAFSKPLFGLLPKPLIIGSIVAFILLGTLLMFWDYLYQKFQPSKRLSVLLFGGSLILFLIILTITTVIHGNHYDVAGDYEFFYRSAKELALGNELEGKLRNYYLVFGNNTRSMLILSTLFKSGYWLGMKEYIPALVRNFALILGSILAGSYLLSLDSLKKYRILIVLTFVLCLPLYSFAPTFYTDSASFGLGVIAFSLFVKYLKTEGKHRFIFVVAAGFFTVLGITEKVTCIIPLIAGIIAILLIEKVSLRKLLTFVFTICIFVALTNIWAGQYTIDAESKEKSNPIVSWVALGMHGDGSFADNIEFSETLASMDTREEKMAYTKQYMKDHIREALTLEHILKKINVSYGEGTFQGADFLTTSEQSHDWVWQLLHPWGQYTWRGTQYCFIYIAVIYLSFFVGSIFTTIDLFKGGTVSVVKFAADLSFMGLFLFLMLWESSNRQLFNQFPMMVVALFENLVVITTFFKKKKC